MAGARGCESCRGKACGRVRRVGGRANSRSERFNNSRADNPRIQLLPIMGTKGCSWDGEGRKDKGGAETVVCDKLVFDLCMCVCTYVCAYVCMNDCMYECHKVQRRFARLKRAQAHHPVP